MPQRCQAIQGHIDLDGNEVVGRQAGHTGSIIGSAHDSAWHELGPYVDNNNE